MTDREADLWNAINDYAAACGGDTSKATAGVHRANMVARVGTCLVAVMAEVSAEMERGVRGGEGVWPSWVYEARDAIRHRDQNIPWLADLHAALGWQGGTIHDALNCVRRLVAACEHDSDGLPGRVRDAYESLDEQGT